MPREGGEVRREGRREREGRGWGGGERRGEEGNGKGEEGGSEGRRGGQREYADWTEGERENLQNVVVCVDKVEEL